MACPRRPPHRNNRPADPVPLCQEGSHDDRIGNEVLVVIRCAVLMSLVSVGVRDIGNGQANPGSG